MKTIDELKNDKRILKVSFPDSSGYEITISEKLKEWEDENIAWTESFISIIESRGYAYTRMGGRYEFKK